MSKRLKKITEEEIDEIVTAEADDDSAWEKPIRVRRSKAAKVPLPSDLAARAAFFARLHHESGLEEWIHGPMETWGRARCKGSAGARPGGTSENSPPILSVGKRIPNQSSPARDERIWRS